MPHGHIKSQKYKWNKQTYELTKKNHFHGWAKPVSYVTYQLFIAKPYNGSFNTHLTNSRFHSYCNMNETEERKRKECCVFKCESKSKQER